MGLSHKSTSWECLFFCKYVINLSKGAGAVSIVHGFKFTSQSGFFSITTILGIQITQAYEGMLGLINIQQILHQQPQLDQTKSLGCCCMKSIIIGSLYQDVSKHFKLSTPTCEHFTFSHKPACSISTSQVVNIQDLRE